MGQILVQGGYMMLCAAGSLVCNVICVYLASRVAAGLSRTLREKVFNQALDLSRGDVDRFGAASLVNRCTNDITQIQNLVSMGLSAIVKAPVMAIWAVVKIVGFGWEWTLATAVAALSIALMLALTVVVCIQRFQKVQGLTDVLNRLLREHLTGVRPVRAYNAEGYERERFSGANDELTDNNLIANRVMAIMNPGMTLVTSGLTLAVYWIGAVLIEAAAPGARLTLFSQMVVFSNYGMQVVLAFVLLNMIFVLLPRAQVAAERVSEVIEAEPAVTDGVGVLDSDVAAADRGRIEFRDVSFTYPDDGTPGLSHVSFTVEPGQTVAVVGATGSGKTTLVQLVDRLFDATEGQVLVDGRDVRGYTLEELHCRIGYIPQTATLFKGTVASNVAYGKTDHEITRDDVGAALAVAQSTDFVEGMEGGLNAAIEDGQGHPAAHPRRGHELGRHPYRAARPARDGRPHGGAHELRHRAPALDDPRRRPHPRDGAWRRGGVRQPRGAARRRRRVRQALQLAVRGGRRGVGAASPRRRPFPRAMSGRSAARSAGGRALAARPPAPISSSVSSSWARLCAGPSLCRRRGPWRRGWPPRPSRRRPSPPSSRRPSLPRLGVPRSSFPAPRPSSRRAPWAGRGGSGSAARSR